MKKYNLWIFLTIPIENQSDRASYGSPSYTDDFLLTVFYVLLKTKAKSKKIKNLYQLPVKVKVKNFKKAKGFSPKNQFDLFLFDI